MPSNRRARVKRYLAMRRGILVALGLALGFSAVAWVRSCTTARSTPMLCPLGPTTPGIDVSYHQQTIDWPRVKLAGIEFAFIRVSDGVTVRDPEFATNWTAAGRAGVLRGAYQFFRPDQSPIAQADLFIAALRGRDPAELAPVIDIEITGGLPMIEVIARAMRWIERVREKLGVEPIVYTGNDLWRDQSAGPLARQPLWLAHYARVCPTVPAPWVRWTFWQHTDRGAVPGIEGPVDLNVFAGTVEELRALR